MYFKHILQLSLSVSPPYFPVPIPQKCACSSDSDDNYNFSFILHLDPVGGEHIIPALKKLSSNRQVLDWGTCDTEPYTSVHEVMLPAYKN